MKVDQEDNGILAARKWLREAQELDFPIVTLMKSSVLISVEPANASHSSNI